MTDTLAALTLGVVEGVTEFLPVSSTGHLLVTERLLFGASKPIWLDDLFNIVIQTGAVLAVIPLFHRRFHQFIFNWRDKAVCDYLLKIIAAFFITGAGGYIMEKKASNCRKNFSQSPSRSWRAASSSSSSNAGSPAAGADDTTTWPA